MQERFTIALAVGLFAVALLLPSQAVAARGAAATLDPFDTVEAGEVILEEGGGDLGEIDPRGCKRVWAARVHRNVFGAVLWKYFQQQAFCYSRGVITSLYDWRRWPHVYMAGWDFKGHIGRRTTGRAGTWHYGTWTQGKFALCAAWCVGSKYPWVDIDVYGNGGWSYDTGGS